MPTHNRSSARQRRRDQRDEGQLTRRRISFVIMAVVLAGLLALLIALRGILFPFIVAAIIAYILEPAVRRIARKGIPRWVSVIVTYVIFFTSIYGFSYYLIPKLEHEGAKLLEKLQQALLSAPAMYENIERRIEGIVDMAQPVDEAGAVAPVDSSEQDSSAAIWGLGPALYVTPGEAVMDVPALDPPDFTATARDGFGFDDARAAAEALGSPGARANEAEMEAARRSHIVVQQFDEGVFGVRFREASFEVEEVGDGNINITPRSERAAENKLKNLQAELVQAVKRAIEQLGHGMLGSFLELVRNVLKGLVGAIIGIVLMFMVAAFILIDMEHIRAFFRSRVPPRYRPDYDDLLVRLDRGLSGVVRGQLMICLVNGVLSGIGFLIFIPEYAIVLAIFAGVLSLIPIFGTILSSVPAVLVGISVSLGTAVAVLLWILGIHFIEANILNPKIIGTSAKINPVIVIFVLIAGEHTFGLAGALLAVPATSVVQSLVAFAYERARPHLWGERAARPRSKATSIRGTSRP